MPMFLGLWSIVRGVQFGGARENGCEAACQVLQPTTIHHPSHLVHHPRTHARTQRKAHLHPPTITTTSTSSILTASPPTDRRTPQLPEIRPRPISAQRLSRRAGAAPRSTPAQRLHDATITPWMDWPHCRSPPEASGPEVLSFGSGWGWRWRARAPTHPRTGGAAAAAAAVRAGYV
ncbi:hypothetical protein IWX46DRAFT_595781, partial [Phyllosticta citricarpa]